MIEKSKWIIVSGLVVSRHLQLAFSCQNKREGDGLAIVSLSLHVHQLRETNGKKNAAEISNSNVLSLSRKKRTLILAVFLLGVAFLGFAVAPSFVSGLSQEMELSNLLSSLNGNLPWFSFQSFSASSTNSRGDGYDADLLDYFNIPDAHRLLMIPDSPLHAKVAILDTGIDSATWKHLEQTYGVDIHYVQVARCSSDGKCSKHLRETDDPDSDFVRDDDKDHKYGSKVASLLAQVAPTVNLWIVNAANSYYGKIDSLLVRWALEFLYNQGYPRVDIISMSFGGNESISEEQALISQLHSKGVELFAATGNKDGYHLFYPGAYEDVYGVGAIFDDADHRLTDGEYMPFEGYRVQEDLLASLGVPIERRWGSTYNSKIDFVAAGYDVEVTYADDDGNLHYDTSEGTSFAAPIVAGVAALVWEGFYRVGKDPRGKVGAVLEITAEGTYNVEYDVGGGLIRARRPMKDYNPIPDWELEYGRGAVDAYDAVIFAMLGDLRPPSARITNPQDGDIVHGVITITVTANDDGGIKMVEFYLDGHRQFADTSPPPWNWRYYTDRRSDGWHRITVIVYDVAFRSTSVSISLYFNNGNDPSPPSPPPKCIDGFCPYSFP